MKSIHFIALGIALAFMQCLFADEDLPPTYPVDPTDSSLATYYQALADYAQKKSKDYAKQAQVEQEQMMKKSGLPPYAIKNATPWKGTNAGLGLVVNTGDTNTQNFNGTSYISYIPNKASTTIWNTTYQYSHDNDEGQLTDKFYTDLNSAFNFDLTNGLYGDVNLTRNPFSGYNYQVNESIGYNRVFFDTNQFSLVGQIGPGLQQNSPPSPDTFQNLVTANIKVMSVYNFSKTMSWRETDTFTANSANTNNILDSALSMTIYDQFALQLDYLVNFNTAPLEDKSKLNTATTVSIVYNF